jgi:hypothetical protein
MSVIRLAASPMVIARNRAGIGQLADVCPFPAAARWTAPGS